MNEIELIKNKLDKINSKNKEDAILLINFNNLGDIICDTPSLRNIRKSYKEKIIFLVRNQSCIELLKNCPYIDEAIEMPHSRDDISIFYEFCKQLKKYNFILSIQFVRPFNEVYRTYIPYMLNIKKRYGLLQNDYKEKYELAFTDSILLSNNTTRTNESLELLKLLNIDIDNDKTECFLDINNIEHFNHKKYIIVQTCATIKARMWHRNNFINLINLILLNYDDVDILLTGSVKETEYIDSIKKEINSNRVYRYTNINLDTLLNYIKNARLVITNDTGPYHFARAFDVKRIVLFGISPKSYLINQKEINSIEISGNSNCPKNCPIKKLDNDCVKTYKMFGDNYNCINTIRYEEIFKNVIKLLKEEEN
ncbi:MAG: glycosyltransferase family 9 protein [Bacilli bacterium]